MKANDLDFKIALEAIDKTYDNEFNNKDEYLKEVKTIRSGSKGFKAKIFKNKKSKKYVICFCGTNDLIDIKNDMEASLGRDISSSY